MKITMTDVRAEINRYMALKGIELSFSGQKMIGIIGPNGSGKTTLLKTLSGLLALTSGDISIDGQSLKTFSAKDLAKTLSIVSQERENHFDFSVSEIVMMGRYPYKGLFDRIDQEDQAQVSKALEKTGLLALKDRPYKDLSGGERQRTMIARTLAQSASLIILDEPTNHLDMNHQMKLFELLKEEDKTVIMAVHDLNVAFKYCDYLVVMQEGQIVATGEPKQVLCRDLLKEVFHIDVDIVVHEPTKQPVLVYL